MATIGIGSSGRGFCRGALVSAPDHGADRAERRDDRDGSRPSFPAVPPRPARAGPCLPGLLHDLNLFIAVLGNSLQRLREEERGEEATEAKILAEVRDLRRMVEELRGKKSP